jgi:hypothetical protein
MRDGGVLAAIHITEKATAVFSARVPRRSGEALTMTTAA